MKTSESHVLYRFFDASRTLLYVGITARPMQRFRAHQKNKSWWTAVANITVENFDSRIALETAERAAIASERPVYNVLYNRTPRPEIKPSVPSGRIAIRSGCRRALLAHCDLTRDVGLTHQLGVNHAQISRILSGKQSPGNQFIAGIIDRCGLKFAFDHVFEIIS